MRLFLYTFILLFFSQCEKSVETYSNGKIQFERFKDNPKFCVGDSLKLREDVVIYSFDECAYHTSRYLIAKLPDTSIIIEESDLWFNYNNDVKNTLWSSQEKWFYLNNLEIYKLIPVLEAQKQLSEEEISQLLQFYIRTFFSRAVIFDEHISFQRPSVIGYGTELIILSLEHSHYFVIKRDPKNGFLSIASFIKHGIVW